MRRYPYIDVARGIGMVLVVAGHAMGISMYLTCFFMQLFFVLSGYVYRQGKSYKQNMKRKTERLLVPYFLGSIVLLGIYKVLGRTTKEMLFSGIGILYSRYCFYNMDIAAEKNNIFFLDIANGAMWYLTSLFTAGAVYYAVIDVCIRSKKKCAGYIICFLAVSVCLVFKNIFQTLNHLLIGYCCNIFTFCYFTFNNGYRHRCSVRSVHHGSGSSDGSW